jgi:predicted PurR-regulated permease PerM
MPPKDQNHRVFWFFLILFFLTGLFLCRVLMSFAPVLVISALVTTISRPVYTAAAGKTKPPIAAGITCLLIFILLFLPAAVISGMLTREAFEVYQSTRTLPIKSILEDFLDSPLMTGINQTLISFDIEITGEHLDENISEILKAVGLFLYDKARFAVSNILKLFIDFILMMIIVFFLLVDGTRLISFLKDISPLPDAQNEKLIRQFKEMAMVIIVVNGLSGLVQGTLGGLVFAAFGFKSPVLWGILSGMVAFLPIVGIPAIFIPVAVFLFTVGKTGSGLFFMLFGLSISVGIDNYLKPKIVGKQAQIHPLLVFLSILGALSVFGPMGFLYGPLLATGFMTMKEIYKAGYQQVVESRRIG